MSELDHLHLDGRLLQLLLTVMEERSITRAAKRLEVTQSAVSHLLDKLRLIVGDPLFVKSGRGIVATARAENLALQARTLLDEMQQFVSADEFEPDQLDTTFTIAANDFQRDLLLPRLLARLRSKAPNVRLRVIPSGIPSAEMLRDEHCQLVISPRPPDATDVLQKRLFEDRHHVFFDGRMRTAPCNKDDYLNAEHVTVLYEPHRMLDVDQVLAAQSIKRDFVARVPGFSGIPAFLRGSHMLATLPSLLRFDLMQGLDSCEVPIPCPKMPMYMIWHLRYRHDPVHRWLREELETVVMQTINSGTRPAGLESQGLVTSAIQHRTSSVTPLFQAQR